MAEFTELPPIAGLLRFFTNQKTAPTKLSITIPATTAREVTAAVLNTISLELPRRGAGLLEGLVMLE